jgi:pantetheine-phosphate adenylyltransferase
MIKAFYPGSFDPLTNGHLDIIKRISYLFDEIVVGVIHNPSKTCLFSLDERKELINKVIDMEQLKNIQVDSFDGLMVNYAKENGIKVVVRGLRATSDFEYELHLSLMNKELYPDFETFFLMSSSHYSFISSSLVREVFHYGGDVSKYLHPVILEAMRKREQ